MDRLDVSDSWGEGNIHTDEPDDGTDEKDARGLWPTSSWFMADRV